MLAFASGVGSPVGCQMTKRSDQYRDNAKKAKAVADTLHRRDMRQTALEIAEAWKRLAEQVESDPEPPPRTPGAKHK